MRENNNKYWGQHNLCSAFFFYAGSLKFYEKTESGVFVRKSITKTDDLPFRAATHFFGAGLVSVRYRFRPRFSWSTLVCSGRHDSLM
jgi:hypothetical protein